jgi:hypothetical protein
VTRVGEPEPSTSARGLPGWFWSLPAGTFLVGLVLGGVVVGAGGGGSAEPTPSPGTSLPRPAGTPRPTVAATVTVPTSCLEAVGEARRTLGTLGEELDGLSGLDLERLGRLSDAAAEAESAVRDVTRTCRDVGADAG